MTPLLLALCILSGWLLVAAVFGTVLGRAVRRNTEAPEPEDWLRIDSPDWRWPDRDAGR